MVAGVEFIGHQIAAGTAAEGFFKAFMELQGQGIDFSQGLFAGMVTSGQGANNHGAASHGAAQITGMANAAAEAIDSMRWPEILGTMAGDNTILVIVPNETVAAQVVARFQEMLK